MLKNKKLDHVLHGPRPVVTRWASLSERKKFISTSKLLAQASSSPEATTLAAIFRGIGILYQVLLLGLSEGQL